MTVDLSKLLSQARGAETGVPAAPLRKVQGADHELKAVGGAVLPVAKRSGGLRVAPKRGTVTPTYPRPKAWSYSAYKQWTTCPKQYYFEKILRIKAPDSPAMARGTFVHEIMELYATDRLEWAEALERAEQAGDKSRFGPKAKPCAIQAFKKDLDLARRKGASCEEEWGLDSSWRDVGWMTPTTWLRLKLDLRFPMRAGVLRVVDHKTGRIYDDHAYQTDLYAAMSFIKFPEIRTIETEFWYLDLGEKRAATFKRAELPEMLRRWENKVAPMMADDQYPCRPGPHCRWCFHRQSNGGKCEVAA